MSLNPNQFLHVRIDGFVVHAYWDKDQASGLVWVRLKQNSLMSLKPGEYEIVYETKPHFQTKGDDK